MAESENKAVQAAAAWLQSGQAPAARAPEVARALLVRDGQLPAHLAAARMDFGVDIQWALLGDAEANGNVALAGLLANYAQDKAVAKHAKKVLFKFKQKGLTVPDKQLTRAPVDLTSRPDPLPSFLTGLSEAGLQFCVVGGWRAGEGAFCVLAMLDERQGLLSSYFIGHASRTQQRELLVRLDTWMSGGIFEVPAALAAGRARYGLDLLDARSGLCDGDLAETRRILADYEPVAEVGFDIDPEDEAQFAEHLAASGALAHEPVFKQYFVAADNAGPLGQTGADGSAAAAAGEQFWLNRIEGLGAANLAQRFEFNAWLLAHRGARTAALQALACGKALRGSRPQWLQMGILQAAMQRAAKGFGASAMPELAAGS